MELTKEELLQYCNKANAKLCEVIYELDAGYYTSSDLILYSDDLARLIDGEVEPEDMDNIVKNVKLFFDDVKV
jgi:hypothetical protein